MMLDKYISDLLYRYQCVTVPGFGAFIAEVVPAQVNGSAATFMPPRKVIAFNVNIKNNDGLLANHVAANENVSFEKASDLIVSEVSKWVNELNQRNAIDLPSIGSIKTIGEDKTWVFEPVQTTNYLISSFGLNQFTSPAIKRENQKKQKIESENKVTVLQTENTTVKKGYGFLKYAAVIAITAGVGLPIYKTYYDQQIEKQTLLVQKNVQAKVEEQLQQATFFIEAPKAVVELPLAEEKMPYHLIAGAFRNEDNAKKAVQLLLDQGYKARVLEKNRNDLYPVTYGSYATLEEAELQKNKIQQEVKTDVWLLVD